MKKIYNVNIMLCNDFYRQTHVNMFYIEDQPLWDNVNNEALDTSLCGIMRTKVQQCLTFF